MPQAQPPASPKTPASLTEAEVTFVNGEVQRIFGSDAVVRNCGPDPAQLWLHVEADDIEQSQKDELLGLLYACVDRDRIGVDFTRRGARVSGSTKIAYRQGVVL